MVAVVVAINIFPRLFHFFFCTPSLRISSLWRASTILLSSFNPAVAFFLLVLRLSSRVSSPSNLFRCKTVRLSLASLLTREQHHGRLPHTEYKRVGGWQNPRNSTLRKINASEHASESRQIYIVDDTG